MKRIIFQFFNIVILSLQLSCQHIVIEPNTELIHSLSDADVIIVGEKHDNPHHHRFQAGLIQALGHSKISAVVMEHVFENQEELINQEGAADLETLLNWKSSGWPPFSMFESIFAETKKQKIPVVGGGIPREKIKLLYKKQDPMLLSAQEKEFVGLTQELPKASKEALLNTIVETHCGYIDNKHASNMLPLQRYKDAYMASQALSRLEAGKSVIILTGAGHGRKDYGIPLYLQNANKDIKIKTLKLYDPDRKLNSDHLLFDSQVGLKGIPYEDPCEKFKKSLQKSFSKPAKT